MRLWTLHPQFLDRQGLLGLWREGLLALAVLSGKTKGYKNHPQLDRFRDSPEVLLEYMAEVRMEMLRRGYRPKAIPVTASRSKIAVSCGQVDFEIGHLAKKMLRRGNLAEHKSLVTSQPQQRVHPLFTVTKREGLEKWERSVDEGKTRGSA